MEIEKLIQVELKKLANRSSGNLQKVKTQPRGSIVSNHGILYLIDSLSPEEFKTINKSRIQNEKRFNNTIAYSGQYNSTAAPFPQANTYSNEDDYPSNAEIANKKSSVKVFNMPNGVSRTQTSGVSIKNGFFFRAIPNVEDASKTYSPKPSTQPKKADLRIEYKKGIIVINGEKISLPNVEDLIAHLSAKSKRLTSTEKDFNIQINY